MCPVVSSRALIRLAAVLACAFSMAGAYAQPAEKQWPPGYGRPVPPSKQDDRRVERERGGPERGGQSERLSPEERRQLREDIGHHGREIYRGDKGGGGRRGRDR